MRKSLLYIVILLILPSVIAAATAKADNVSGDLLLPDSITAVRDNSLTDSLATDSARPLAMRRDSLRRDTAVRRSRIVRTKADLETAVDFSSKDSMIIIRRDTAFMYGEGSVKYGDISLQAAQIKMDLTDNSVYAVGREDSLGEVIGSPVFNESGTDYEASTMRYNFKTRKGFLTDIITQQGEGYLTGGVTKKDEGDDYYIQNGRYTTCDNHECPHFYMQLTKAKVRPGKNIVVGPAYMVLAGLPLPLAVPFGFFPFTESYSSGVIVPTFGDDYNRGFYLSDGGYYFAINDNIDMALTGEIYTKGSWGLQAQSNYVKRYKYSGNFNISYLKTITGEKGEPDYSTQTNFQVLWSHTQDTKANPNMNLSASVNFTTSGYSRNDLNSYYSPSFTENTKSSTVNLTYRFPGTKWSLSSTLNVSQRTQDSTLSVSFPNFTLTMSQTYPFKRKKASGDERWYEKIKMSYSGQFQNSLTAKQNEFFKKSLIKDWRNGMNHTVPVSATFNAFNYLNITPSLRFGDRMYTTKVKRSWDPESNREMRDTTYGFYNVWDFQASVSMDTKVYGFFQPMGFLGKKVKMIRWVITPSLSFSGAPDFGSPFFGYYGQYKYTNTQGQEQIQKYSYFPNGLFGVPSQGKNGSISMSIGNNVEMKVKSDNDSIGEKKISLIENFNISQSYNLAADSLNWSDINTTLLLRLTKGFNLNLNATWDVYTYALSPSGSPVKVNKTRLAAGKGLGRLMRTGTSFSYTFNNDTFKRKKDRNTSGNNQSAENGDSEPEDQDGSRRAREAANQPQQQESDDMTSDGYVKWSVPWNLTFNYSINYGYGQFNKEKMEYDGRITQNLSFSGNIQPTPAWNFAFSASYNFDTHKLAYMNCNLSRDLHCFTLTASFVPVGPYKSYNVHIAVNSAMLSDLKYDKRSSMTNGVRWY